MENNTNSNRSNWLIGFGIVLALLLAGVALVFTLTNQPEPATVDTAAISQEVTDNVLAALPTPAPTADPLDVDQLLLDVEEASARGFENAAGQYLSEEYMDAQIFEANTTDTTESETDKTEEEPADTTETEVLDSPVLTPTFELELTDYFTMPITFAGGPPIALSQNGDWFAENTANATWDNIGTTWKAEATDSYMPGARNVFGPSGVLGIEDWNKAQENNSGIWLGSIYHDSPDNTDSSFSMLCPEGSFCSAYALNFGLVEIGPAGDPYITLSIPPCGPNCGQGLIIQNWLERPQIDLNTTVIVSDYGEPSAASYTEYAVDPQYAERFSEDYATDQAVNSHIRRNNGSGPDDNTLFIQHVFTLPDMSYTILGHTMEDGWFLIWTSIEEYGEH